MKIIRNNIFETNSSSTHALVIYTKGDIKIPDKLRLDFGEFGWGYQVYYDTYSKASYIITLIYHMDDEVKDICLSKFEDILNNNNIQYTLPVTHQNSWGYDDNGYVDHGDEAIAWLIDLLNNEEKLFMFLFDNRSYVSTGNDNERGYYIPDIGYEDDYRDYSEDSKHNEQEWDNKIKELESQGYEFDYKGN